LPVQLNRESRIVEEDSGLDISILAAEREVRARDEGLPRINDDTFGVQAAEVCPFSWTERASIAVKTGNRSPEGPVCRQKSRKLDSTELGLVRRLDLRLFNVDEEMNVDPMLHHHPMERLENALRIEKTIPSQDDPLPGAFEESSQNDGRISRLSAGAFGAGPDELWRGIPVTQTFLEN